MNPYITYHVNTFNRLPFLKNLLKSFEVCNEYENFEWVIMDYGSTDGTRDFLFDFMKSHDWVSVVFGNEKKYFEILESKGRKPKSKRLGAHTIFGYSRNVARQVGRGDMFIDIADDHQFIRKGNWVKDFLAIRENIAKNYGKEIGSIIYRGLSLGRINKPNNERYKCEVVNGVPYYRAMHKHYDDYHFMSREAYNLIGDYLEAEKLTQEEFENFSSEKIDHYRDYLKRAEAAHVEKVFLKYPYVVDFPNGTNFEPKEDKLSVPLYEPGEMERKFKDLTRPVSSDEIFRDKGIL